MGDSKIAANSHNLKTRVRIKFKSGECYLLFPIHPYPSWGKTGLEATYLFGDTGEKKSALLKLTKHCSAFTQRVIWSSNALSQTLSFPDKQYLLSWSQLIIKTASALAPVLFKWWNLFREQNRTWKGTVQEKEKVGSFRKMPDKIPLLFPKE